MSRLWSEEEDTLLREICASGEQISAPNIAIRLSKEFSISPPRTKAAVVGRARRLKLDLPLPCDRERRAPFVVQATPQHNSAASSSRFFMPREPEPDPRQKARGTILPEHPRAKGVYLLNAADDDCRRPINDPPAGSKHLLRVCGEPIARRVYGGVGYCDACLGRMLSKGEPSGQPFILSSKRRG